MPYYESFAVSLGVIWNQVKIRSGGGPKWGYLALGCCVGMRYRGDTRRRRGQDDNAPPLRATRLSDGVPPLRITGAGRDPAHWRPCAIIRADSKLRHGGNASGWQW